MNTLISTEISAQLLVLLITLIAWSLIWKGWALWTSARNESKIWFIVLLILNTGGILEILYIFIFSKKTLNLPNPDIKI